MACLQNNKDRVLVVDDQEEIRRIISRLISFLGYEVVTAGNGREGLQLFSLSPFDLVITDLDMPVVDGLTFAYSIKERSPHTPVVMITGNGWEASQGGPVDLVMHKPFSLADLENAIQMFLNNGNSGPEIEETRRSINRGMQFQNSLTSKQ